MQVVTCLHSRFHVFVSTGEERDLAKGQELEVAFEAALTHVERSLAGGMKTMSGDSARPQLEKLKRELTVQRDERQAHQHLACCLENGEQRGAPRPLTHGKSAEVERRHSEQEERPQYEGRDEVGAGGSAVSEDDRTEQTDDYARDHRELYG